MPALGPIRAGSEQMRAHRRVVARRQARMDKTELRQETEQLLFLVRGFLARTTQPESEQNPIERCMHRVSDLLRRTREQDHG